MKTYQSDFLDRVKLAIESCENAMLVYRKQGYESKAFRLQLKQLAVQNDAVFLEDRHTFTFVLNEYSRIGLHTYKQTHEVCDKFRHIRQEVCSHFGVPEEDFSDLCKNGSVEFRYVFMMLCYFLKVSEDYVLAQVGKLLFEDVQDPGREYITLLEQFRHEYQMGKRPSELIDEMTESIKRKTEGFTVYSWTDEIQRSARSLFLREA